MNHLFPDPNKLVITIGVSYWMEQENFPGYLLPRIVINEFKKQPDEDIDGGNDKRFFVFKSRNQKFFVAENEIGGLTIMLPEEY